MAVLASQSKVDLRNTHGHNGRRYFNTNLGLVEGEAEAVRSAAQSQVARGLESVGIGGGRGVVRLLGLLLLGHVLLLLLLLGHILLLLLLLGHVLWLLVVLLDWSGGGKVLLLLSVAALERGIVPALIVLAILDLAVQLAGNGGRGVVRLLGLLLLLDITGSGRCGSLGLRGRSYGQVVTSGTESVIKLIQPITTN